MRNADRSRNLRCMELTDECRARIARGWRQSGRTQAQYAAEHRISDRTLRIWIARWAPSCPSGTEAVRDVCERAIERLRALIDGLGQDNPLPANSPKTSKSAGSAGTAPPVEPQSNVNASTTDLRSFDLSNLRSP
jgi:hypothetical protein